VFPASTFLYHSLIHPHLLFALPICGSTFPTYLAKLQKLQNKAIRYIANTNSRSSITPQFRKLGILKIQDYTWKIAKIMHHHSKQALAACFSSTLQQPLLYTRTPNKTENVLDIKGQRFGIPFLKTYVANHIQNLSRISRKS